MTIPVIPVYGWPGSPDWSAVLEQSPPYGGILIVTGANSGPGNEPDPALAERIQVATRLGWQCIGYVPLDQLRRPLIDVTRDITKWRSWYPEVRGIFYDETPLMPGTLEAMVMLEAAATRLAGPCVINTGVDVPDRWFSVLKKALIVEQENSGPQFNLTQPVNLRTVWLMHHSEGRTLPASVPYGYSILGAWHAHSITA